MENNYRIRLITTDDAVATLNVYAPYVLHTGISFEYDVPQADDFKKKIEMITAQYPWLVCEYEGQVIGYVYGSTHRDRTGYQWSPEVTAYLDEQHHRKGIARVLYSALFEMLKIQGYFNVFAGVLATNIKSVEFHRAMGFEDIGLFKNIGYKLGEWHTNLWMQLNLQECVDSPAVPLAVGEIEKTATFENVMMTANNQLHKL